MRAKREVIVGICPLCDRPYTEENNRTKHHVIPVYWNKLKIYKSKSNVTVCACEECHEKEFNSLYPMKLNKPWTRAECVMNWLKFCISKGKDPLKIYPQLSQCFT